MVYIYIASQANGDSNQCLCIVLPVAVRDLPDLRDLSLPDLRLLNLRQSLRIHYILQLRLNRRNLTVMVSS